MGSGKLRCDRRASALASHRHHSSSTPILLLWIHPCQVLSDITRYVLTSLAVSDNDCHYAESRPWMVAEVITLCRSQYELTMID